MLTLGPEDTFPAKLWTHGNKRIRIDTMDALRNEKAFRVIWVLREGRLALGAAGAVLTTLGEGDMQESLWSHACAIVREEYRGRGIGTLLVRLRIAQQRMLYPDVPVLAYVAADNLASIRMVERTGLVRRYTAEASRPSGRYTLYTYAEPEKQDDNA